MRLGLRTSKYRHCYGQESKNAYEIQSNDSSGCIAVNAELLAAQTDRGVTIFTRDIAFEKANPKMPTKSRELIISDLSVSEQVRDVNFHPFNDRILTVATKQSFALHEIPHNKGGENKLLIKAAPTHSISTIKWNPIAPNILAVATSHAIEIWDVEAGVRLFKNAKTSEWYEGYNSQGLGWNLSGSQLAVATNSNSIQLLDPRTQTTVTEWKPVIPASSVLWVDDERVLTLGSGQQEKVYTLWSTTREPSDLLLYSMSTNESTPTKSMIHFDHSRSILYIEGLGRPGSIRYDFLADDQLFSISEYRSAHAVQAMAALPPYALDTSVCEIAKLFRRRGNLIFPLSFLIPRKASTFQDDLYPDIISPLPCTTAQEWQMGINKQPPMVQLQEVPLEREPMEFKLRLCSLKTLCISFISQHPSFFKREQIAMLPEELRSLLL